MSLRKEIRAAFVGLPARASMRAEDLMPLCPSALTVRTLQNNLHGLAHAGKLSRTNGANARRARYVLADWPLEAKKRASRAPRLPRRVGPTRNREVQKIITRRTMTPRAFWSYIASL